MQLELFRLYLDELWQWNQKINLTGLQSWDRMVIELLLDSLIPAPFLPQKGSMLDVGSGAGFPGLPLKIYRPGLETDLMEVNSKKVSFLRQVLRVLKLEGIQVIRGRIEGDRRGLHAGGYHIITARAVAALSRTIPWCAPLLCKGGLFVGYLGARAGEVLERSQNVIESYGLLLRGVVPYFLPGKGSERNIVLLVRERTEDFSPPVLGT